MTRNEMEVALISLIEYACQFSTGDLIWARSEPDIDWDDDHVPMRACLEWQSDEVSRLSEVQHEPGVEATTAELWGWCQMKSRIRIKFFRRDSVMPASYADRLLLAVGSRLIRVAEANACVRITESRMCENQTVELEYESFHESRASVDVVVLWTLTAEATDVDTGTPKVILHPHHPTEVVSITVPEGEPE